MRRAFISRGPPEGTDDIAFIAALVDKLANGLLGPQNGDIDGADTIWAFFSRFP